jgi:hypothetical protein
MFSLICRIYIKKKKTWSSFCLEARGWGERGEERREEAGRGI